MPSERPDVPSDSPPTRVKNHERSSQDLPEAARLHIWQIQALRDVMWVGAFFVLIWLGYAMRAVTVPLLVALLLAYLFEPVVAKLARHPRTPRLTRPMVVGGLLCTVGIIVVATLAILIPIMRNQAVRLYQDIRTGEYYARALAIGEEYVPAEYREDYFELIQILREPLGGPPDVGTTELSVPAEELGEGGEPSVVEGEEAVDMGEAAPLRVADEEQRIRRIVREELAARDAAPADEVAGAPSWLRIARGGAATIFDVLGAIVKLGFLAFLIPFYFFFFSVSFPKVLEFGRDLIPEHSKTRALDLLGKMDRTVAAFVRGRIVISLLMGVMFAAGWAAVGVPYAILAGMLTGVFSAVPYLGGVGIPLAIGLFAFDQVGQADPAAWWWIIGGPLLIYVIVQVVETYFLTPVIAGRATNLAPVTIVVAVIAGGSIGGVYGMLLAIPVAACLKIICTDVLLPRIHAWTKGEVEDPLPIGRR